MRILMVGDVIGRPGRAAFAKYTPKLRREQKIDLVVVNGENSADGKGVTRKTLDELTLGGADVVTSGNHIWDKKDVLGFIDDEPYLLRPANYPAGVPGKGACVYLLRGKSIGVMNLSGRAFLPALDCPFQRAEELLRALSREADVLLLDFHAESTSEKMAMGWYLDGRVAAVVGTHTHVQTADERILPGGTAFISDLGMVGPWNSVIGFTKEPVLAKTTTGMPARFEVADGPAVYSAVIVTVDDSTGKASDIARIQIREDDP
ncbi:MAG: TIGR00282 family metallophosphoesterase [Schwartzia sp.]|nr:TIGR00282 family metallophosphoesterase [Schwartzia sp. (in: firmicutes)]